MVEKTATAKWSGNLTEGSGTVTTDTGVLSNSAVSWASRTNESKQQTSPEELMAAAHAACYAMAFSNYLTTNYSRAAVARRHREGRLRTEGGRRDEGHPLPPDRHRQGQGMDQATFADAAKKAEAECPVSNAYRGNMEITVDAKLRQ